jgi:hypothetical protein
VEYQEDGLAQRLKCSRIRKIKSTVEPPRDIELEAIEDTIDAVKDTVEPPPEVEAIIKDTVELEAVEAVTVAVEAVAVEAVAVEAVAVEAVAVIEAGRT